MMGGPRDLIYRTPSGEVHPAHYEPQGRGWLRTFLGGLLTTCGLTYLGPPCRDGSEELGLHGRYSTTPGTQVCGCSSWESDEYRMEVSGTVEECAFFGDKIRLRRTISTMLGSKALTLHDVVENFGYRPAPFTILYHINPGFPLLDVGSELLLASDECIPFDSVSAENADNRYTFSPPLTNAQEQNFLYRMRSDEKGWAHVALANRLLYGGMALYLRFDTQTLPYLNEWKMMGAGEYVVGLEPSNSIADCRARLRERGELPSLEPGSSREMHLEIGVLDGLSEIDAFAEQVADVMASTRREEARPSP